MATATLERVRELGPVISTRTDEIEQARRLPLDLVDDLIGAGCFRMLVPHRYGGDELSLSEAFDVIEELAYADGSTGWTTMIGCAGVPLFGSLPRSTFEEIYADGPDVIGAGALAPKGRAVPVTDGYRISGQWPFASGCQHSSWFMGQTMVLADGQPQLLPGGMPVMRVAVFPADEVEILDTWHTVGLQGTGSHDISVSDAFCPEQRTFQMFGVSPTRPVEGTIFAIPVFSQLGLFVAAAALGIGRAAIHDMAELAAGGKRAAFTGRRVAESAVFQDRLGEADAILRAARALLHTEAEAAWTIARGGRAFSLLERARLRATGPQVVSMVAQVVDAAYTAGGGTSVYDSSPLQRRLRDIRALTQHAAAGRDFFAIVGALLAGEEIDPLRV
jgi:alkylation response protein AidB-like acyl-CoA dehydrogenase